MRSRRTHTANGWLHAPHEGGRYLDGCIHLTETQPGQQQQGTRLALQTGRTPRDRNPRSQKSLATPPDTELHPSRENCSELPFIPSFELQNFPAVRECRVREEAWGGKGVCARKATGLKCLESAEESASVWWTAGAAMCTLGAMAHALRLQTSQ